MEARVLVDQALTCQLENILNGRDLGFHHTQLRHQGVRCQTFAGNLQTRRLGKAS